MIMAELSRANAIHWPSSDNCGDGNASARVSGTGSTPARQSQSVPSATNATARPSGAVIGAVVGTGTVGAGGSAVVVGVTSGDPVGVGVLQAETTRALVNAINAITGTDDGVLEK